MAGIAAVKLDINIFVQIGFVVLVGLASKNAILIVEFAKEKQAHGASPFDATIEACRLRLRPIIMTSLAFILGVVPLALASGAGAEMRRTLGIAVFSGMLGVTFFGIFLTQSSTTSSLAANQSPPHNTHPRGIGFQPVSPSGIGFQPVSPSGIGFQPVNPPKTTAQARSPCPRKPPSALSSLYVHLPNQIELTPTEN